MLFSLSNNITFFTRRRGSDRGCAHVHGDEGCAEDQQQDGHLLHARLLQGGLEDQKRVPRPDQAAVRLFTSSSTEFECDQVLSV
jgi:hypothetical protein